MVRKRTWKVWVPPDFAKASAYYISLRVARKPSFQPGWIEATLTLTPPPPKRKQK